MSGNNTAIYLGQPEADGTQTLTVDTNGTLAVTNGAIVIGSGPAIPALPTGNGVYNLTVSSGVATWTVVS